jgi:hypothetical protein
MTGRRFVSRAWRESTAAVEHPVRHLDFETVMAALPVVTHTHPFDQVPLQYSIHVE